MNMKSKLRFLAICSALCCGLTANASTELTTCSEVELKVALLFNVGTASLHLEDCSQAENVLGDIPKQFSLQAAREFKAEDLTETAVDVLVQNLELGSSEELPADLACMANAYVDAGPGDRFDIVYEPEDSLAMFLNDELVQRCDDQGYGEKYFMIWFGEEPFHQRLRDRLLEKALQNSNEV